MDGSKGTANSGTGVEGSKMVIRRPELKQVRGAMEHLILVDVL